MTTLFVLKLNPFTNLYFSYAQNTIMPIHLVVSFVSFASSIGIMAISTPFFAPLWMQQQGITPEKWGVISSIAMVGKIIFVVFICEISDKHGSRKPFIILNAGLASLLMLGLYGVYQTFTIGIIWLAVFLLMGSLIPLSDALLLTSLKHDSKASYSVVRSCMSLAYMLFAFVNGWILEKYGIDKWPLMASASMFLVFVCVSFLPNALTPAANASKSPMLAILKVPWIKPFILVAAFIWASHVGLTVFGPIFWKSLGFQESEFGILLAAAIIPEIIIFFIYRRFTSQIRPTLALLVSASFSALRWILTAHATSLWEMALVNTFHGLTFAITHAAVIEFLRINVPQELRSSGQAVYDVFAVTAAPAIAAVFVGMVYQHSAQYAFYTTAGIAMLAWIPAIYILLGKPHYGT